MSALPSHPGSRGDAWVIAQLVLIVGVIATALGAPGWQGGRTLRLTAAVVLVIAGLWVGAAAVRALGTALTIFPRPRTGAPVARSGPYRVVRHPMYSAGLALAVAVCLAGSPWAFVPIAVLGVVLDGKARREERWLRAVDPGYADLCRSVRWRFVPGLR